MIGTPDDGNNGPMAERERMSTVDTAWLRMDRPNNLMMIVGVLLLDGPIDADRLRATLEARMLERFPRFRQRPVQDATGWHWEADPRFRMEHHVRVSHLARGGPAALQRLVGRLAARPLDPRHPRWQFHLVDGYNGGAAVIVRFHHCYADGIALVGVMLQMTDPRADSRAVADEREARPSRARPPSDGLGALLEPLGDLVQHAIRLSGKAGQKYLDLLRSPDRILRYAGVAANVASEVAELATMADDSRTLFKDAPTNEKRVAWAAPVPLEDVKAVGKALGCSVNDVLLSCAAGALRRYLVERGESVAGVEMRAMVPVNLRGDGPIEQLGNRFGLVTLLLPVGTVNPLMRLQQVHDRMEALKSSYQPLVAYGLLAVAGLAPQMVQKQGLDMLANKASAVMTNVPGPRDALYLCGRRISDLMFWVPQSGNIGLGVSILSYAGGVQFGLITDAGRVPDPQKIVAGFAAELERLVLATLMEPWDGVRDPAHVERELAAAARGQRKRAVSPPSRTSPSRRRAAPSRRPASP
jgi:diacylglycerol O-acyltransferase / wax synthase